MSPLSLSPTNAAHPKYLRDAIFSLTLSFSLFLSPCLSLSLYIYDLFVAKLHFHFVLPLEGLCHCCQLRLHPTPIANICGNMRKSSTKSLVLVVTICTTSTVTMKCWTFVAGLRSWADSANVCLATVTCLPNKTMQF